MSWRPLYEWGDEEAFLVDRICSNWFSCTFPTEHVIPPTIYLFKCRIIGNEWHRILNNAYGIRKGDGVEKEVTIEIIVDKAHLLELIDGVFGVKFVETDGIDRYLD
jgi:hypothetical protein